MKKEKFYIHSSIPVFESYKKRLDSLTDHRLKSVINILLKNINRIENVSILPVQLVINTSSQVDFYRRFHSALIKLTKDKPNPSGAEIKEEMKRIKGKIDFDDIDTTLETLNDIIENDPDIKKSFENLFRLNTVYLWTVFEALCHELWKLSVNNFSGTYGKNAFFNKKDRIVNPLINELTANDFKIDLKNNLGDFLINYFDFSGVLDIIKSYKAIFGDKFSAFGESLEKNIDLKNLQLIRNLIVHKAGIIDKLFKETTSLPQKIGDEIYISGEKFEIYADKSIGACVDIIEFVHNEIKSK